MFFEKVAQTPRKASEIIRQLPNNLPKGHERVATLVGTVVRGLVVVVQITRVTCNE